MTKKTSRLELLQIPRPCPADWENMPGNERKRFCTECNKPVYNLSAMTRREAEALIEDSQGKVCARFTRLADGQILTQELPMTLHRINRRPSPIAATLVTAMMSLTPVIAATQPSPIKHQTESQTENANQKNLTDAQGTTAKFSGTIFDPQRAVIAGARVTLIEAGASTQQTTNTSVEGKFYFETVKSGTYMLRVEAPGFASIDRLGIVLNVNQSQEIELTLAVARTEALGGAIAISISNPLRTLYTESDRVVIARIGESLVVETEGESKTLRTTLQVSSTLKGSGPNSTTYLYHSIYEDEQRLFKQGDNLLLFLKEKAKQKKQKAGYELFDSARGVKKLSDDDLKVYTRHINELAINLADGKLENAELIEWLVRCAEDRATRWEGATELASSVRSLQERQEAPEEEGEEVDEAEAQDDSVSAEAVEETTAADDDSDDADEDLEIAAKLSDSQRERLVKALLSTEKFEEGDLELLDVVSYFKEPRLVPFLVSHLHQVECAPPKYAENLINTLAEFLNDEALSEAAEKYSDEVSYEDLEGEGQAGEAVTIDRAAEKKAVIEQRSQLLKQFLSLVEKRLSQPTPLN